MNVKPVQESARKLFGADIEIMIARCRAWGHEDSCIIVRGKRHSDAAAGFAKVVRGAKLTVDASPAFMGAPASTFSVIEWA